MGSFFIRRQFDKDTLTRQFHQVYTSILPTADNIKYFQLQKWPLWQ